MAASDSLIFTYPSDNALADVYSGTAPTVALGAGTTLETGYSISALGDMNPANGIRFNEFTGTIEITFAADFSLALAVLAHHNLDAGLDVRIQSKHLIGNAWGSSVDQTLPILGPNGSGYRPYTWRDFTATPGGDRWWRLNIAGTNSKKVSIGEFVFAGVTRRRLTRNYDWQAGTKGTRPGRRVVESRLGVQSVVQGVGRRRTLSGTITGVTDAILAELVAWEEACNGPDLPCVIIPKPTGTVMAAAANEAWIVRFDQDLEYADQFLDNINVPVSWTEVARGRPWTT